MRSIATCTLTSSIEDAAQGGLQVFQSSASFLRIALILLCLSAIASASHSGTLGPVRLKGAPVIVPERVAEETDAARRSIAERGYVDRQTEVSESEYALRKIQEKEAQAQQEERATGLPVAATKRGFYRIGVDVLPSSIIAPSSVPSSLIDADSENYLIPAGGSIVRLYSQTKLGRMLVREIPTAQLYVDTGDARTVAVGGFPVYLTTVQYHGNEWATVVLATRRQGVVQIEIGIRIEEPEQQALLEELVATVLSGS